MCEEGLFGRQRGRGTEEVQCGRRGVKYRGEVIFISLGGDVEMMSVILLLFFFKKKVKEKVKKKVDEEAEMWGLCTKDKRAGRTNQSLFKRPCISW